MTKMGSRRTLFFTGFPGFIARRLVRALAAGGEKLDFIFLVVEEFAGQALREAQNLRADPAARGMGFEVVVGDISRARLGLHEEQYREIAGRITDVFHLAAIYDLAVPEPIARQVNVTGTKNVVELCRETGGRATLVYYSTCYVAGKRTGTVLEDELEMGQGFKNHYESTKHDAEIVVRAAMDKVPTIVIRPSIVVGDSKTGETQKFDGPYFGMILVDTLKALHVPLPYLGPSKAEVNLVPIDFIIDGSLALWRKEGTRGRCYALADPRPVSARRLYAEIVRQLGAMGPIAQVPPLLVDLPLRVKQARTFLGVPPQVLDYFNHDVHFDTKNATAALQGTGVSCPHLLDYLPVIVDFYKRNKHRKELRWKAY
jgi:thioester reductase-like protein